VGTQLLLRRLPSAVGYGEPTAIDYLDIVGQTTCAASHQTFHSRVLRLILLPARIVVFQSGQRNAKLAVDLGVLRVIFQSGLQIRYSRPVLSHPF